MKGGGAILDALKGGRAAEGAADDAGRAGAAERSSGSAAESNSLHVNSYGLADDAARLGRARDDLANSLERSPLDDGGSLIDDLRGGDHLVRPEADLTPVHPGGPDAPPLHVGDPDVPGVHHGVGGDPPAVHHGDGSGPAPERPGDAGQGRAGSGTDGSGAPVNPSGPPVAGTVVNIGGHDIWLPDGFTYQGGDIVRHQDGVPGSRISAEDYAGLRERSVHNGASDTLVLGRFLKDDPASYIDVAKREGATYFDMGLEWGQAEARYGLSPRDDMFNFFNRPVLDEAIRSGKTIRFSHDPRAEASEGKFLEMEALYLEAHGFTIMEDANGWIAIR
ncbi:hypothetical protein ACF044_05355 [Microbacterium sp. NPDC016588]